MNAARPPGGLGDLVAGLLALNAVASLASLGLNAAYASALDDAARLEATGLDPMAAADFDALELLVGFVAVGALLLLVTTAVTFLIWFQRVYDNLDHLGMPKEHGLGWTVGAWVIPILNLFRPFQMMKEVWEKSAPAEGDFRPAPTAFGLWWTFWIGRNFVDRLSQAFSRNADTFPELRDALYVDMIAVAMSGLAAFFAMKVVRLINVRQSDAIASRTGAAVSPQTF